MTDLNRENLPTTDPATEDIIEQTVITETATPETGHAPEHAAPKKTGARTFLYGFAGGLHPGLRRGRRGDYAACG